MAIKKLLFFSFICVMLQSSISAQVLLPLNNSFSISGDKEIYSGAHPMDFTSSKPLITKPYTANDTGAVLCKSKVSWLKRKIFFDDFLSADTSDFSIRLNPLFDFSITRGSHDKSHFRNTRGILINGNIGKTLYFQTNYYETQASFSDYIADFISIYRVVPGQTRVKDFKSKSYDYGIATALISWSPKNFLNLTFGHDKVFLGDGYRSLLLSDFTSPYPFMRITATFGKFQCITMFSSFQNLKEGNVIPDTSTDWNAGYVKKTGTFHYLTWKPIHSLQISFFEGTLWKANASGYAFNLDKFNPIPFFHTIEFGLNNTNNVVCGINFNYRVIYPVRIYGQFVVDNYSLKHLFEYGYRENKTGFQIGFKAYEPFQIRNFTFQWELNSVRPYTYSNASPIQSWSHYNQPLAHPFGANFIESVVIPTYRYKRLLAQLKIINAKYGSDGDSTNYGKDIFSGMAPTSSITGIGTGHGLRTIFHFSEFQLCWLLNPRTNMNVFAGVAFRNEQKSSNATKEKFLFFGIRTSLMNEYFDF